MPPEKKTHKKKITKKVRKLIQKPTRTHFNYTEEALAQAIQDIRTKNKSIREACRYYDVPRSTVQDRISGRTLEQPRKVGPEPILGFDGEQKVVDWIIDLAKCGIPVHKELLLDTVAKLLKDVGKAKKLPRGRPGQTWYNNFLKRHPQISLREPEGINKAREAVRERTIRNWFTDLESFLIERGLMDVMKDPERILNADETGVSLCPKSGKVLAPKGYKNVYIVKRGNEKETITVLITMTASGKICPPLVVFPYIRPPKAVVDNMPEGWTIGKTESGWMRSDVFYEYIANDFKTWLVDNNVKRPVILFVDGHKSHISMPLSQFCEENDIVLYALPPNTTHIMQPADVSVFRPLKQEWKKTVRNWQARKENHNETVTKTNFCKVFEETLSTDMTAAIKNGFKKCGLYPFDAEAVDFTKCVKDFQERRKNRSLSFGGFTERDYAIAQKVVLSIKDKLLGKGVDTDIVCNEIELAKYVLKEQRQSTSKTPRTSTEVVKSSTFKSPDVDNSMTKTVDDDAVESFSLLEDISIPDVGSYVSLCDISVIKMSDIHFEDSNTNTTQIIPLEDTEHDKTLASLLSQDDQIPLTSKVITVAEVHCNQSLRKNAKHLKNDNLDPIEEQAPIFSQNNEAENAYTITAELYTNTSTPQKINNIENKNMFDTIELAPATPTSPQESRLVDPFKKHLKFPIDSSKPTNKRKNISKFPSAISSKAWRDYHEMKEKEKQNKINEKSKRKIEREQKKNEPAAKKKKIITNKNITKPKVPKCEPMKDKQNTNKNEGVEIYENKTDEKTEGSKKSDRFMITSKITINKKRVNTLQKNKKWINIKTKETTKKKSMDILKEKQVKQNSGGEKTKKIILEESAAEIRENIDEYRKETDAEIRKQTGKEDIGNAIIQNDVMIENKDSGKVNKESRRNIRKNIEDKIGMSEEDENILLSDLEETDGKTVGETNKEYDLEDDDLSIF